MLELKNYLQSVLDLGVERPNRQGEYGQPNGSISVFGSLLRFNLAEGFPLTTSKELKLEAMAKEITWMIRGETNVNTLGSTIWNKWALTEDLATRTSVSEGNIIGQLAMIRGVAQEDLTPQTYHDFSEELFQLQLKHVMIEDGTMVTLPNEAGEPVEVPLTLENITPYTLAQLGVNVNFEAFDEELRGLGIKTHDSKIQYSIGECGPIYGEQWRRFKSVIKQDGNYVAISTDQFMTAYDTFVKDPFSRRNIISAWNPGLVPVSGLNIKENIALGKQGLPPCHVKCQFLVNSIAREGKSKTLTTILDMRSSDGAVGLAFNIAAYAFITHLYAAEFNMAVGDLVVVIGDGHIYNSHLDGVAEYIDRPTHTLPTFTLVENYEEFKLNAVKNAITEYVDQLEYATPEERQLELDKQLAKINLDTPNGKAAVFKLFLDTLSSEVITNFIKDYKSEPFIKFDLHD